MMAGVADASCFATRTDNSLSVAEVGRLPRYRQSSIAFRYYVAPTTALDQIGFRCAESN